LVDAAIRVLRSGRKESNWVQAVAAEAGAAKGTFYLYFASWEEMLVAVRDRAMEDYLAPLRELVDGDGPRDWWAVLDAECDRAIDFIADPSGLHAVAFHSPAALVDIDERIDPKRLVARLLRRGIDEGAFRSVDTDTAAVVLFSVVHAAGDAIAAGNPPDRWRNALRDLTRHWLAV
jgi:AcrR family transcriptional regulator